MKLPILITLLALTSVAVAQPMEPPPAPPPPGPVCKLTEPPPPRDPKKKMEKLETEPSKYRQFCEDELLKDKEWWFNLEERLGRNVHKQAAKEITTNNRHVVAAYAAMWLLAVAFVVVLWRRQQRLKLEIERLSNELEKAAGS